MYNLNKNENQYGPAPACYDILKDISIDVLNSYPRYNPSILKDAISKYFNIDDERIILGYGAEDIMRYLFYHYVQKNQNIIMADRSWYYYRNLASYIGANLYLYSNKKNDNKYEIDIESLYKTEKENGSKMLVFCSPDNPTGSTISYSQLEDFLKFKTDGIVLFDEAYWGYSTDNNEQMSEIVQKYPNIMILRTFSKYFALAGIRIGYAFCGDKVKNRLNIHERLLGFNRISELVCIAALNSKEYYAKINDLISSDRDFLISEINKLDGFKAYKSSANFFLVDIPDKNREDLKKSLEKNKIVIKFLDEPGFEKSARITVGTGDQNKYLLKSFKEAIGV